MRSLALTFMVSSLLRAAFNVFGDSASTHPARMPNCATLAVTIIVFGPGVPEVASAKPAKARAYSMRRSRGGEAKIYQTQ